MTIGYRPLGASGIQVSELGLGTMTFGRETSSAEASRILDSYAEQGGNFIDTADIYSHGDSERIIGEWVESRKRRADAIVIATKARFSTGNGINDSGLSRKHLRHSLDESLRRLRRDYIDLYQVHAFDRLTPVDETLQFLTDAITAGKILYYGLSNCLGWQIEKFYRLADSSGCAKPTTVQIQYNLLSREVEYEVTPAAADCALGVLAWSPLAGGWLTGKYGSAPRTAAPTRLSDGVDRAVKSWLSTAGADQRQRVVAAVAAVASNKECLPAAVALAWLLGKEISAAIVGARTLEQLNANLRVSDCALTAQERADLDLMSAPTPGDYPYGDRGREQRKRR